MFCAAIFKTYFSHKYLWILVTDYYIYFYLLVLSCLSAILELRNFTAS